MTRYDGFLNDRRGTSEKLPGIHRRHFLQAPAAVAATSLALPAMFGSPRIAEAGIANPYTVTLAPHYYPLGNFTPQLDLSGKLAVITGASRGNGRATAEALIAQGVEVIGTSRNVKRVPNLPSYPLLDLDITSSKSVRHFAEELRKLLHREKNKKHSHSPPRKVDILINNAGRYVLGSVIRPSQDSPESRLQQLQLGMDTLCNGHIHVTEELLPLMPTQGYARLLFTVSVAAYWVGGTDPLTPWLQGYISGKKALLAYANSLRGMLQQVASNVRVSTVNPYSIATTLPEHPNPIYLERVMDNGFTDDPPSPTPFNQILALLRQQHSFALPPALVGTTYAQLLTSSTPPANVVVGSPIEPFATQGGNQFIESAVLAENLESAFPFQRIV